VLFSTHPTATLELKSEFKQSSEKRQSPIPQDRPVKTRSRRKPRAAADLQNAARVKLAVGQNELPMTQAAGKDTFFLRSRPRSGKRRGHPDARRR